MNEKKQMKLWKKIVLGFCIILLLTLVYLYYKGSKESIVPIVPENTQIYQGLVSLGLKEVVVDGSSERVIVSYNLINETTEKETYIFFISGSSYRLFPTASEVNIIEFKNLKPLEEIKISMADIKAFAEGTLTEQDFKQKWIIKAA